MISEAILWITAVWARKPVSDSVPPTRTGLPEGAARRIDGAASAAAPPIIPAKTRRRRHAPTRSTIVSSDRRDYFQVRRYPDVGITIVACKRFFESFAIFRHSARRVALGACHFS